MIFKKIFLGTLATAAVTLLASCGGSDLSESNRSRGEIELASLQIDSKVTRSGLAADDNSSDETTLVDGVAIKPELNDCKLIIMSKTGTYLQTWDHVSDYKPSDNPLTIGTYDVTLSYGALEDEGFDKPYYYGSATTTVKQDETSEVSVEATLCNTMVKMKYTDAFKKYFTDYTATIHSDGGKYITFEKDETRAAYVRPGNISIDLSVTKPNGLSGTFEVEGISNAAARTLYNVTVDVNDGGVGDAQVTISFDDETILEPIAIKVSDEILAAPAPTITPSGFTPGTALSIFEGNTPTEAAKMQIMARSGLQEVTLTTQSTSLLAQGFPAEIELMSASEEVQKKLAALGFAPAGLWKNPGEFALIDFTNLISHIKAASDGDNTSTFTLQVKDKYSKVCEQAVTMTVTLTPLELSLTSIGKQTFGSGTCDLTVKYNGEDFAKNVSFQAKNKSGFMQDCPMTNIKNNGDGTYSLTLTGLPNVDDANEVNIRYKGTAKKGFTISTEDFSYSLSYNEGEVWAKQATIGIGGTADAAQKSIVAKYATFYIGTTSGSLSAAKNVTRDEANGTVTISGLTAGTKYYVAAKLTSASTYCDEISFTTEAATAVPNGGLDELTAVSNLTNRTINQGGTWSNGSHWTARYTTETYNVSEPTSWATTNAKTACESAKTKNTWFFAPSVYNTTSDALSGNAMVIRNIGWDLNGSVPERSANSSFSGGNHDYSNNTPSIANTAAGKMFLGSYSFDGTTETYNQGVAFTSRPASLSLAAKYVQDSQDTNETGIVKVELLNGSETIGSGEQKITASSSWKTVTVPITYSVKNKKATTLRIFITSSSHYDNSSMANETNNIQKTKITEYTQKAIGAVLTVDNLTFAY